MPTATGYMISRSSSNAHLQHMYLIARKILDSSKVKFGGFSGNPVIFRIPSGYARTGAYISSGVFANSFYVGLCDFDTLENRINTRDSGGTDQNSFVAVYDTGEFIAIGTALAEFGLELLDPVTLNPVGFMVLSYSTASAIIATQNDVITTSTPLITPEPIRVSNTVYVSRVYFLTPLGIVTNRHLYSGNTPNTKIGSAIQVGSKRFIQFGSWLVDVTGEV